MDADKDRKRKKDKHREDDSSKKKSRARSRSRSPENSQKKYTRKRRLSRSQSPTVKRDKDDRKREERRDTEVTNAAERKAKDTDMLNTRTGGAYIPPARLRMMQAQITDKSSIAYQRLAWEALKKSIHGHINKINVGNIGIIIKELLKENIVRGRGLLCRSVIQAQAASPTFTNVYAALVSAVNSRFPNIGELLLKRLVIQFKRGFKRNDKPTCISSASFIAHLVNQRVAHEILALELLTLLVETPTDDSVEVSIAFLKECGQKLTEVSSKGVNAIFEMLRNILHEGQLDKRVQYMIEVMFQVWKDGFKDHPALIEELELVPEEEQFTHLLMLDDATDPQDILNVFKHDEKYEENEQKYKTLSKEILGSDAESGEDGSGESGSDESDEEEADGEQKNNITIIDNTETNLVALRRTIYLTINSSLDFEECAHKLMKMQLKPGQEVELCHMFLDCCAEQRTYEKFYGLLAQRFCNINRMYIGPFEEIFKDSYLTAHRLDTNRLRNVSKFFAHLLFTDSISWEVLECVKLNEEDTTSSSRIYIKILFQELAEYMGLKKLNDRLKDPTLQEAFSKVFPRDNPKNTRFSINFFTSIGLGGLTDELREHLKQMPKNVPPPITQIQVSSSESSSSSSDSSSESSDSSASDEEENKKEKRKKSKKNKDKDKSPKTPEPEKDKPVERWGHDGFYDTYGQDARRETRAPGPPPGHFARPRDPPRGDRRDKEDGRRHADGNEREDNRRESRRHQEDGSRDETRNGRDDSNRRENKGSRRYQEDGSRDETRNGRDDSNRRESRRYQEDGSRDEIRNDRERDDDRRDSRRYQEDGSRDETRNGRDDSNKRDSRRYQEDRRGRDDESRYQDDKRKKDDRDGRERHRDEPDVDKRRNRDDDASRAADGDRERRKEDRSKRSDKDDTSRSRAEDERRGGDDESSYQDDRRKKDDRDGRERYRDEPDVDKRRNRDDEASRAADGDRERRKEDRSKRSDKVDTSRSRAEDERRGGDDESSYQDDRRKKDDRDGRERHRDESDLDKRRNRDDEASRAADGDRHGDKERRKEDRSSRAEDGKRVDKERPIRDETSRDADDDDTVRRNSRSNKKDSDIRHVGSDSDDERRKKDRKKKKKSSKYEKENIDSDFRKKRDKRRDDSDSEDESSSRREKDEGWDIRRASSIHKEIPDRYWDSHKVDTRDADEKRSRSNRRER